MTDWMMKDSAIWNALEPLRQLSPLKLGNRVELQRVIAETGLNGEFPGDWPVELHPYLGRGLHIWQYPIQFADYLIFLSQFLIQSYLEIGARDGGTMVFTVEYLSRFNPIREAVGVDIVQGSPVIETARSFNPVYSMVSCDSQTDRFRKFLGSYYFDLIMVDGLHTIEGMMNDFDAAVASEAKLITCHDIWNYGMQDQCYQGWLEIKKKYNRDFYFVEFVGQYDSMKGRQNYPNLGIGLAVRSDQNV